MAGWVRRLFGGGGRPSAETLSAWVDAQQEITRILAGSQDLAAAAPDVLQAVGSRLGWDLAALYWVDHRTEFLRCIHQWKRADVEAPQFTAITRATVFRQGNGVPGAAWKTLEPVWVADLRTRTDFTRSSAARADGIRSILAFPVRIGPRCFGVVELASREARREDPHLVHLVATFGSHLGQFTLRTIALQQLRAREEELEDLFQRAPLGVVLAAADGRILRANAAELKTMGYEKSEYVGTNLRDAHVDPRVVDELFQRLARGEDVKNLESEVRTKDGTFKWIRLNANAQLEGGAFVRARCFTRDVTASREAAALLAKSEERYRGLVEGARGYAIVALSPDGHVTDWNSGAEALHAWSEAEALGLDVRQFFTPEDREDGVPDRMLRLAADEGRFHHEGWSVRKDGSRFWAEITLTALRGEDGQVREIRQLTRDASDQRRMEALRRKAADLEAANVAVVKTQRKSAEFARTFAASLEGPASEIERAAAKVQASGETGHVRDSAESILRGVAALRHALARAGDLVHPQAGMDLEPDEVDLLRLAVETRDMLRAAAAERRIRVDVDVDPELPHVVADPVRLRQIVYNLLSNAIRYSRERGRVALRLLPEGPDSFRIEVEDAGIGIAPADVPGLFEFRDDPGDGRGGVGVGLPATKRIVEHEGGRISVQSAPGRGSVFSVVLPRVSRSAPVSRAEGPAHAVPAPARTGESRRVLVVAEDATLRASLSWTFGSAGYEAIAVPSAAEAIDVASERACDIVAIDLLLHDGGAPEFVANLRSEGSSRSVPRVYCVVQASESPPAGLLVSDVVPRPAPADRLFAALERAAVPRGIEQPILVLDGEIDRLRTTARTLEVLGYRVTTEADSDRALSSCAEEPPAAVVLAPFPAGLDAFEFLHHLRAMPRCGAVPVVLTAPNEFDDAAVQALKDAARRAAAQGAGRPAEIFGDGVPVRVGPTTS